MRIEKDTTTDHHQHHRHHYRHSQRHHHPHDGYHPQGPLRGAREVEAAIERAEGRLAAKEARHV